MPIPLTTTVKSKHNQKRILAEWKITRISDKQINVSIRIIDKNKEHT
jgi:hypothetical protein